MTSPARQRAGLGADAATVAALFAIDTVGLGGVALRAEAGSARDEWLGLLRELLPDQTRLRRIPINIQDAALLGGLDLGATLQAGRPVAQSGVLAQADGGVVILPMAERLTAGLAARLAAVLDTHDVVVERDGLALRHPARLGVVALDEGVGDDERMPAALLDRLAFHLQFSERLALQEAPEQAFSWQRSDTLKARALLSQVSVSDEVVQALCAAALALGVFSLRAPLLALRAARAAAALSGCAEVGEEHAALAARLVLAPRATQIPAVQASDVQSESEESPAQTQAQAQTPPEQVPPDESLDKSPLDEAQTFPPASEEVPSQHADQSADDAASELPHQDSGQALAETVLEAAQAAIPPGLLAALKMGQAGRTRAQAAGRSGASQKSQIRGRPLGARRGEPRSGARLNVIETLRAAAPWQKLRQQQVQALADAQPQMSSQALRAGDTAPKRIHVRREDFHVTRFKQVGQTTTLFVVDASGSSALHRLSEAKGAVELLLADCYVRRDRVAVLAFRGKTVELLLPPTRSLARAKRSLAALPGGGGTPLAAGIDAACALADQISRRGETPIVVLLTDGRANIARDGTPGRMRANEDALVAARQVRQAGFTALLLDTSPQPQPTAELLAQAMGAAYVPLPYAGSQLLSQAVRLATGSAAAVR